MKAYNVKEVKSKPLAFKLHRLRYILEHIDEINPIQKSILIALTMYATPGVGKGFGRYFVKVSRNHLTKITGYNRSTITKHIKILIELGFVKLEVRGHSTSHRPNIYSLNLMRK